MSIRTSWMLSVVLLSLSLAVIAQDQPAAPAGSVTQSAWQNLKTLPGQWEGEGEGNKVSAIYRATSAGSVIMETLMPGTDHEMVSMYHMDGSELVMTHYCAVGNQPHLKLDQQASKPGYLVFTFAGGTNMDPAKDGHIHAARFRIVDNNRLESEWDFYKDGKLQQTAKFQLTRKP